MDMDDEDDRGAEENWQFKDAGEISRTPKILSHISEWSRRNIACSFKPRTDFSVAHRLIQGVCAVGTLQNSLLIYRLL